MHDAPKRSLRVAEDSSASEQRRKRGAAMIIEISTDTARGGMYWGPKHLPMGMDIMGVIHIENDRQLSSGALMQSNRGQWYIGSGGNIRSLPQRETTEASTYNFDILNLLFYRGLIADLMMQIYHTGFFCQKKSTWLIKKNAYSEKFARF
jgi:hypothetical protein